MATPNEKLAISLSELAQLQAGGRRVFRSHELSRVHRARLLKQGFIQDVMKGWVISSGPRTAEGESTPWYASFWEFCALYCNDRFGDQWYLSPEQSIFLHAANTVIPTQLVVYSAKGTNNNVPLLFGTSLYDLKQPRMPQVADVALRDGLRLFSPAAALIRVPETFFSRYPIETQVVLTGIGDASDILSRLLAGGHSVVAGRLVGAFRRIGRADVADDIVTTMKAADYVINETDPFTPQQVFGALERTTPPIVRRIDAMWKSMRQTVIDVFPRAPGLPKDQQAYLNFIDGIYESDAYHSLSIEGYQVTPALIERVRSGAWAPQNHDADSQSRDVLAARGYWQAFQQVRASVAEIIAGKNAGAIVRTAHREWYREMFQPCIAVGLLPANALAGYRNDAVYLRASRYVPPRWEAVRDAMPTLFDLLEAEPEPSVRAVLGHWLLGYVHPYPDGNGRMARFLMNAMLASGGYPWTVIRVGDRSAYLNTLDSASVDMNIAPFANYIAERIKWSMQQPNKRSQLEDYQ
jgi:fido (protein-threonine AMPylation protein)